MSLKSYLAGDLIITLHNQLFDACEHARNEHSRLLLDKYATIPCVCVCCYNRGFGFVRMCWSDACVVVYAQSLWRRFQKK